MLNVSTKDMLSIFSIIVAMGTLQVKNLAKTIVLGQLRGDDVTAILTLFSLHYKSFLNNPNL